MKVLFLDIDGVCNSLNYAMRNGMNLWHKTDPDAVKLVRDIIDQTGCKVVLSSSWRLAKESRDVVRRDVCEFIDVTPSLRGKRGYEVKRWLDDHPEVTNYAILDDDSDFLEGQPLFKTSFNTGLNKAIANQVIIHLNKDM